MTDDTTPAESSPSASAHPPGTDQGPAKAKETKAREKHPPGTSPQYARMHTIIRRTCYVLLFGLVLEGALTFPLLAAWYGFPKLSLTQVCSELQKVAYSDEARDCDVPYSFPGPPLAGPAEAEGQSTARDVMGVQPKPLYDEVEFREFVERHKICEVFEAEPDNKPRNQGAEREPFRDYCAYLADKR